MAGVGNQPIPVRGVTRPVKLEWGSATNQCRLVVLPKLQNYKVILGMDVLRKFEVRIHASKGIALPEPEPEVESDLVLDRNVRIPAQKSKIFLLRNELPGLTLFEPGDGLPEGVQGVPTLSKGAQMAVQLNNHTDQDVLLNSQWKIGEVSSVQLVVKLPVEEGNYLPEVPKSLSSEQQK